MNAALKPAPLSVEEYLEGESLSDVRHEFVGGQVFAMAGATKAHNRLALNIGSALLAHFREGPCAVFVSDIKVRLALADEEIFYYPDVVVACDPRDTAALYCEFPNVIVEILSDSTEQIARREKFLNYKQAPSVEEYILVAQDRMEVTVFRRANQWRADVFTKADTLLELTSFNFKMMLGEVYRGVSV